MSATIEENNEPTHLGDRQSGICMHMQARFRFGKYKNFRVRDVWEADKQYVRWLGRQDWFIEKHPTLVTLDEPESPRTPRATREVKTLDGGCRLIRLVRAVSLGAASRLA